MVPHIKKNETVVATIPVVEEVRLKKKLSEKQLENLRLGRERRLHLLQEKKQPVAPSQKADKCKHCQKMSVTQNKKIIF